MSTKTLVALLLSPMVLGYVPIAAAADESPPPASAAPPPSSAEATAPSPQEAAGTMPAVKPVSRARVCNQDPDPNSPPIDVGPCVNGLPGGPPANLLGDSPLNLSGYAWEDVGYMWTNDKRPGSYDQKSEYMQGRVVLRGEYTYVAPWDLWGTARVELIGFENEYTKSQYEPHTLDAWIAVGQKQWNVQVGRFLPWEIYYRGQGIELFTAEEAGGPGGVPMYRVSYGYDRFNEPGQAAVHLYPVQGLGIEVSGVYGQEGTSYLNYTGVRPVVDFKLGGFEAVAGAEYFKQSPQRKDLKVERTQYGYGGRLQYTLPFLTVGADFAKGHSDKINADETKDGAETYDRFSVGGWVDGYLGDLGVVGVGYHRTEQKTLAGDRPYHDQAFVSYLYRLPIEGLRLKLVYGYAKAHVNDNTARASFNNTMQSVRLRLEYLFQ